MSMGKSHAHMRESMESISAFSSTSASASASAGSSACFCSPIPALSRRLVPRFASLYVRHLPRIVVWIPCALVILSRGIKMRISMGEPHERWRTACAYWGVNGVTFRFIVQSSASGSSSALRVPPLRESSRIQSFSVVLDRRFNILWQSPRVRIREPHE
jgi:hypothetical protein